jgi:protoheme IX farnesyltransferase
MLPCTDEQGRITGLVSVLYCVILLPASMAPVALGAAGWLYGAGVIFLGLGYTYFAGFFAWKPSLGTARNLFLSSILYLPLLLILLVSDSR